MADWNRQPPNAAACLSRLLIAATLTAPAGLVLSQHQVPEIYRGADLKLGEQLIAEHRCATCHVKRVGGDGSAIYRPAGRINTPGLLRGMVEQCNTEMGLGMFPEEVNAVAAVLNRDHYRFGAK